MAFLTPVDQALLVMAFHTPPARVGELDMMDGQLMGSERAYQSIPSFLRTLY